MSGKTFVRRALCALIACAGSAAAAGGVDESEITGAPEMDLRGLPVVSVCAAEGSDDNDGSEGSPVRTVARALELAAPMVSEGPGARVAIRPGIYREIGVVFTGSGDGRLAPLVIEGTRRHGVVWTGAQPVEQWTPAPGRAGVFITAFHGIPSDAAEPQDPVSNDPNAAKWIPGLLGRQNVLARYDGVPLRQVLGEADLTPMTFRLVHGEGDSGTLEICLPPDRQPGQGGVEISGIGGTRPLLEITRQRGLVIRDIAFRDSAQQPWFTQAVRVTECSDVRVERVDSSSHNTSGLGFGNVENLTVRDVRATSNGASGVAGVSGRNQRFERCEFSRNGWRTTVLGGQLVWYDAGIKHGFGLRDAVFIDIVSRDNDAVGFWLDYDMENIDIHGLVSTGNTRGGMWWEASCGPGLLASSRIENNLMNGLLVGDAGGFTVRASTLSGNAPSQIVIAIDTDKNTGEPGRTVKKRDGPPYQSGPDGIGLVRSTVAATAPDQHLITFAWGNLPGRETFLRTFFAEENTYWHPTKEAAFPGPIPRFMRPLDLDGWRNLLRAAGNPRPEFGSAWRDPSD